MKPRVSAIIPNFNYAQYVGEAIESALAQTFKPMEVIVIDDGSTDESISICEKFGKQIKLIRQENAGVSAARNNAVRASSGEFVAFLDADDVWLSRKIEEQVEEFKRSGHLGLVHVGVQDIDEDGKSLVTHLDGLEGEVSREMLLFNRAVILGGGSGFMIPRKVFEEIGGFDLRLSTSADWDFCYQVSHRFEVGFIPEVLLKYRMHSSNMHGNIPLMEREMLIGFEKAFDKSHSKLSNVRRESYGNLHRVLAGSYFRAGNNRQFARHAAKSIWQRPQNIGYFLQFPFRRIKRNSGNA